MAKITFVSSDGQRTDIVAEEGDSVMRSAVMNDVAGIEADCGGSLACATCHVYVDESWIDRLPAMSDAEDDMLDFTACERAPNSRLSCQLQISEDLDGLVVHLPQEQS